MRALLLLALLGGAAAGQTQRLIIKHAPSADVAARVASARGLELLAHDPRAGLTVVARDAPAANERVAALSSWEGVELVEEDVPRFLHRPLAGARGAVGRSRKQAGSGGEDCSAQDKPLPLANGSILPEYQPYGIAQVQATSSKLPRRTDK